jgi:dTDP-4-amino-4,6-dideoxygalactose transaminase
MIPISKPSLGKEELNEVKKVINSGFIVKGPKTASVESLICKKF